MGAPKKEELLDFFQGNCVRTVLGTRLTELHTVRCLDCGSIPLSRYINYRKVEMARARSMDEG